MCVGIYFMVEDEFEDLMEEQDEDLVDEFFSSIPWCYDQYDIL